MTSETGRRMRASAMGIHPGILAPGPLNAITDVSGVKVGQATVIEGDSIRTGATAILPHGGNLFQEKVPAGLVVGNGFGKLMGSTQVIELGELESPVVLTNTLSVPDAAKAIISWTLSQPENKDVRSVNPVVGETNDGWLNDIRRRVITTELVLQALESATEGVVEEGAIGAGTGTIAFGWKGGIGTSSRILPTSLGGYTVGALVQTNFDGVLQICSVPVGQELGRYFMKEVLYSEAPSESIMMVLATDSPLSDRNLTRLARRAFAGLARTGAAMSNFSGDYAIAFSTADSVRRTQKRRSALASVTELPNDLLSPLFQAAAEAVEEAIYNSLFMAYSMSGYQGKIEALPVDRVLQIIQTYRIKPSI